MRIFFNGMLTEPRLDHPEGIAIADDGAIWCGGEQGQIYRIEADGSSIEQIATTGGFCLGMTFGPDGDLYVCDIAHRTVFRLAEAGGNPKPFALGFRVPNVPVFGPDGMLYVSDSNGRRRPGPGIWRVDGNGRSDLWYDEELHFANGLAFAPDGRSLYVAETDARRISRIPIEPDGSHGVRLEAAALPDVLPDGLAFGPDGLLYVACYEPSCILRVGHSGSAEVIASDPEAFELCHPTNIAFRGATMFAANLGRWHITEVGALSEGG